MEWLDQLKVGGPLAVVLGLGLVALWQDRKARETASKVEKDALAEALQKSQEARIADLKEIAKGSSES